MVVILLFLLLALLLVVLLEVLLFHHIHCPCKVLAFGNDLHNMLLCSPKQSKQTAMALGTKVLIILYFPDRWW